MEVLELAGIGEIKVRRECEYQVFAYSDGSGAWGLAVSVPFGVSRKQVEKFLVRESGVDSQKPERYESL